MGQKSSTHEPVSTSQKLEDLYALIDKIEMAMMVTRTATGQLVSRAMSTQKRASGADLWFASENDSDKVREIERERNVNLSYYRESSREWVSVSGNARVVRDRAKIRELYAPDWKAWFGDEGGERNGGPDDPRIVLIAVDVVIAHYMCVTKPKPVVMFEVLKGMVTGTRPDVGEVREVNGPAARH